MNKKIMTSFVIAGTTLVLGGLMSSAFAQDINTADSNKEGRPFMQNKGNFKAMQYKKGEFMKSFMNKLDEATQSKVKTLHESHKAQVDALKDQFGEDKEAFMNAMKELQTAHKAELQAILPADVVAQMKEFEANHTEKMMGKRTERINSLGAKTQKRLETLSSKITNATAHLSPEKMQTVFTTLISKLQDKSETLKAKATTISDNTSIHETIALIDALILDLQNSIQ